MFKVLNMVRVVYSKTNTIFAVLIIYCIIIDVAYCAEPKPEVTSQSLKDAIQNRAKPTRTASILNVAIAVCINAKSVALKSSASWEDVAKNPGPVLAHVKDNICCTEYINHIVLSSKILPIFYFMCNKCSEHSDAHDKEIAENYEPKSNDELCTDDEKQDAIDILKEVGLNGTKIQNHNLVRAYYEPILAIIEKHELAAKYVEVVHKVMPREIEKDLPTIKLFIDKLCGTPLNTEEEKPVDTASGNLTTTKSGNLTTTKSGNLSTAISGLFKGARKMSGGLSFTNRGNLSKQKTGVGNLSRKQSVNQPPPSESTNEEGNLTTTKSEDLSEEKSGGENVKKIVSGVLKGVRKMSGGLSFTNRGNLSRQKTGVGNLSRKQSANQPPPSESTNEEANQPSTVESTMTPYDEYYRDPADRNVSGWTRKRFIHDYVFPEEKK